MQLIDLICANLVLVVSAKKPPFPLILTGSENTPVEVNRGLIIERNDLPTTNEEADVIIVQQAYHSLTEAAVRSIQVICDDTDVFILWPTFTINWG